MIEDLGKNEVYEKYVHVSKKEKGLMYGTLLSVRKVQTETDSGPLRNQEIRSLVLLPNTRSVSLSQGCG